MNVLDIDKLIKLSNAIEDESRYPHRAFRINAVRGDLKIPVSISHGRESGYYGSARLGKYSHSSWGKTPAEAFVKIVNQLVWTLDKLTVEANFQQGESIRLTEERQEALQSVNPESLSGNSPVTAK